MTVPIRPAHIDDGPALREIERSAGARFRDVGLAEVAEHEPASVEDLAGYAAEGRSWVAVGDDGAPIGYVLVDVVDGNAHVEQVSVRPEAQGRGVGRALIDEVDRWAQRSGRPGLTLTTFADVSWNGPLYRHLGFRVLGGDEIGPELRALTEVEAAHGLDPAARVCMHRPAGLTGATEPTDRTGPAP
jgi:ribosomal protein S18 acetylase RimI-like enzyme